MPLSKRIKKLIGFMPGFENKIDNIAVRDIEPNPYNPRKKFGQEEEDELIESINSKGILQPIIVYKKGDSRKYILLDGQRRLQCCKKLGIEKIPAHILVKEPTLLENLSLMFHIHNVHEDWTDLAIATTIEKLIHELKFDKNKLSQEELKTLQKLTSFSMYKIKKYLDVLKFSKPVLDKFMEAELKEKPDLDIDLLAELRTPLKKIHRVMPAITDKYSEDKFVDIFIQKKKNKIITTNKQIRKLSKIITNAQKGKINKQVAMEKITEFLENENVSIEDIYSDTAEAVEQAKTIIKMSEKLKIEIDNIDLRKVPREDKVQLMKKLKILMDSIKRKV